MFYEITVIHEWFFLLLHLTLWEWGKAYDWKSFHFLQTKCFSGFKQAPTLCGPDSTPAKQEHLWWSWFKSHWPSFIKFLNSLPTFWVLVKILWGILMWLLTTEDLRMLWTSQLNFRPSENSLWPKPTTSNFFSTLILIRSLHKATKSSFHSEYFSMFRVTEVKLHQSLFSRVFRRLVLSSCTDTHLAVAKPS